MLYFFGLICTVSILCGTSSAQPVDLGLNPQYSLENVEIYPAPLQDNQLGGKIQNTILLKNLVDAIREKLNENGEFELVYDGEQKLAETSHEENSKVEDEGAKSLRKSKRRYGINDSNRYEIFSQKQARHKTIEIRNVRSIVLKIEGKNARWKIY